MDVAQTIKPLGIDLRLADLKHDRTVAIWLHAVNQSRRTTLKGGHHFYTSFCCFPFPTSLFALPTPHSPLPYSLPFQHTRFLDILE